VRGCQIEKYLASLPIIYSKSHLRGEKLDLKSTTPKIHNYFETLRKDFMKLIEDCDRYSLLQALIIIDEMARILKLSNTIKKTIDV